VCPCDVDAHACPALSCTNKRSGIITRYLCWVPSAQQLPPDAVCSLLEAAVRAVDSQGLAYVCEALPGARQLGAEQSVRLLTVGWVGGSCVALGV
jgi:hypothetical protein